MEELKHSNCPNCNAPINPETGNCDHCGTAFYRTPKEAVVGALRRAFKIESHLAKIRKEKQKLDEDQANFGLYSIGFVIFFVLWVVTRFMAHFDYEWVKYLGYASLFTFTIRIYYISKLKLNGMFYNFCFWIWLITLVF